jgi:hypothetical protein
MSISGVPLALGGVAVLVAISAVSGRVGSAAMREIVFDGITLQVEEEMAERAEYAWTTYAARHLGPRAKDIPTRPHFRTLANRLEQESHRRAPSNTAQRGERDRMEQAAASLREFADYVDSFRTTKVGTDRPRDLKRGDRVRARGALPPDWDLEDGRVYEVHLTPTAEGMPMITLRKVEESGRVSRHETRMFALKDLKGYLKKKGYPGMAGGLVFEHADPMDLPG